MKCKSLFTALLFCLVCLASVTALAQTVVISPRKTVYRRPKPLTEFKKTFTVRRPIARASTPTLSKTITATISPETVLQLNIKEEQTEYQWLEEADYEVLFNRHGILCIRLWMVGTAAYPDDVTKTVVINLKNGAKVTAADVFVDLDRLAALIKKAQQAEIQAATKEIKSDPANADARPEELFSEADFTRGTINEFVVSDNGVTFPYDYGFPHVLSALQPEGEYFFTWADLKPFIKSPGLLERFVR